MQWFKNEDFHSHVLVWSRIQQVQNNPGCPVTWDKKVVSPSSVSMDINDRD
jgi:hypothetical protein